MKKLLLTTLMAGAVFTFADAQAAEKPKAGDIVMRARALQVMPEEDADITVIGGNVDASNTLVPEIDFSYYFTDNISAELILATTRHNVSATAGNLDLGHAWLLPPTLTAQYHFVNDTDITPYIGAGINYTMFYNEKAGKSINNIDYDNSFGPAAQIGVDYALNDKWSLNADLKKVWINTDVSINSGAIKADVDLDPWLVGFGVGYKF